jgi:hypothetical protein
MLNILIGLLLGIILSTAFTVNAQWQPGTPKNYERMDQQQERLNGEQEQYDQNKFRKSERNKPC